MIYIKDLIISLNKKNIKTIIPTVTSRLYFLRKFAIIIFKIIIYYVKIKKIQINLIKAEGLLYKQKKSNISAGLLLPLLTKVANFILLKINLHDTIFKLFQHHEFFNFFF